MQITMEQAYAAACRSLGEAVVREQVLTAELERLTAELAAATAPQKPATD